MFNKMEKLLQISLNTAFSDQSESLKLTIRQLIKYSIIGIFNTLIGLGVIYIAYNTLKLNYIISNVIGYLFGLINSFIWNRKWTFHSSKSKLNSVMPFLTVFIISYIGNIVCVIISIDYLKIDPNIAQLFGVIGYSTLNFLLNKFYTF
jgi:putative flippase GtrA